MPFFTQVNPKAAESLADPAEYPNLFEDWQVALAVENNLAPKRCICYGLSVIPYKYMLNGRLDLQIYIWLKIKFRESNNIGLAMD